MGKRAVRAYFRVLMLLASVVTLVFTVLGVRGGDTFPGGRLFPAALTFVLPGLCAASAVLLLYWLLRRSLYALIPLAALAVAWRYMGAVVQLRGAGDASGHEEALTVVTYNVRQFGNETSGALAQDVCGFLSGEGADIVCLQEFKDEVDGRAGGVTGLMAASYPYSARGRKDMAVFSRFPIASSRAIPFEYSDNSAMWADVRLGGGRVLRVFNVHMETTGVSATLRSARRAAAEAGGDEAAPRAGGTRLYRALMGNYALSLAVRGGQSALVERERRRSPHPVVLCGDFNDVPYSYTYHTLLGGLRDGFREAGRGFMYTYRGSRGVFRIDYVFHDPSMRCVAYESPAADFSDHKPVVSRLLFK